MSNWYAQFMRHPEFKGKVRKLSNKIAKTYHLLPTFSEEFGPRQSRPVDDDSEGEEAAELDMQDINMPSLSLPELNSADLDYVDQGEGYDCSTNTYSRTSSVEQGEGYHCYTNTNSRTSLACTGTDGSTDEDQDENMSHFCGMEPV